MKNILVSEGVLNFAIARVAQQLALASKIGMRIALVHDYLVQYGGAERVLEAFSELFPHAPIFTLVYDEKLTRGAFRGRAIHTSYLQKIPFSRAKHRFFPLLMPFAVEQFDLSRFDIVLSDSASFAKGVITKPPTLHISYCHTPPRYAWDDSHKYIEEFGYTTPLRLLVPFFMNYVRIWDGEAATRVDRFITNSEFVRRRIEKYYRRNAEIIYPPVDTSKFEIGEPQDYFLMVGRLSAYKKFDLGIEVFNELGRPLKIVGAGPERKKLEKMAKKNIEFVGAVSDEDLAKYYKHAKALIFPQEEDFGIVAVEAMASGRPVIAYRGGGALETVQEGETGVFFDEQTLESLAGALRSFDGAKFDPQKIRAHALKFDRKIFKENIKEFIEKALADFRGKLT